MKESLVCCSIPRNLLLKQDYDKSIDKAEHTDNRISSDFYNVIIDVLIEMLNIQLADNQKACWVDDNLRNIFKKRTPGTPAVRAQYTFYDWLNKTTN